MSTNEASMVPSEEQLEELGASEGRVQDTRSYLTDPKEVRPFKPAKEEARRVNNVAGRMPVRLTQRQAKEAAAKNAEGVKKDRGAIEDLPAVVFPTKVELIDETYLDFTGDVAGVQFANGKSTAIHSFRRLMQIAGSGWKIKDQATGIEMSILGEGKSWRAVNKFWNYGMPIPEGVETVAEKPAESDHVSNDTNDIDNVEGDSQDAEVEEKVPEYKTDKHKAILHAIKGLRPGHKEDFTAKGLPDCNRLSAIVDGFFGEDEESPFSAKVNTEERDKAWTEFNRDKLDEDVTPGAFSLPLNDDIRSILGAVARSKGLRVLKDELVSRGFEDIPRDELKVIDLLIGTGITKEEAGAL